MGRETNHVHVFWECHKLNSFWENVHATIKDILGYTIPKECKVMYLGNIDEYVLDEDKHLTKILLITSKKVITRNWYKTEPPTVRQWLELVKEICIMERMTYQLRMRVNVFDKKWMKWMIYDISER